MKPILPQLLGGQIHLPLPPPPCKAQALPSSPTRRPGLSTQVTQWREAPRILPLYSCTAPSFKRHQTDFFTPTQQNRHTCYSETQPGIFTQPQCPELAVLYPDPRTWRDVPPPPMDCTAQTLLYGASPSLGKCKQPCRPRAEPRYPIWAQCSEGAGKSTQESKSQ